MLDAAEAAIGPSPIFEIWSGTEPSSTSGTPTGTKLVSMTLPADFLNDASSGQKTLKGTWQTNAALASGTAAYYRIYDSTHTTCHEQCTVTAPGGGGLEILTLSVVAGQPVTVTALTYVAGNP